MADKTYKRQGYAPDLLESDNISVVTDILLETIRVGRPAAFDDSIEGLNAFKQCTINYLEYVQRANESRIKKKVMIDIESWACFLGITRATIATYERTRGEDWQQFIAVTKNGIAAAKKEAAFHGQLQPMIAVFDLANNHSYKNTNEFKLEVEKQESKHSMIPLDKLPTLIAERYDTIPEAIEAMPFPEIPELEDNQNKESEE